MLKRGKVLLHQFNNRINKYIQTVESDFRLVPQFIPLIAELQLKHEVLLRSYAQALVNCSRLTFFVSSSEIEPPFIPEPLRPLFFLTARWMPIRLLTLRPLVKFYIELHVRAKLKELQEIYTQARFLLPQDAPERENYLQWLAKAKTDCENLLATLSIGKLFLDYLKYFSLAISALILASAGASSISELIIKYFFKGETTTIETFLILLTLGFGAVLIFPLLGLVFIKGFTAKRAIFLNIQVAGADQKNIYILENDLFDLIKRHKKKEVPVDYSVKTFLFLLYAVVLFFVGFDESAALEFPARFVMMFFFLGITVSPAALGFYFDVFRPWQRRYTQKYF